MSGSGVPPRNHHKNSLPAGPLDSNSSFSGVTFFLINLFYFIYFIFGYVGSSLAVRGLSLVVASGGYSLLRYAGFSLRCLFLLRSMVSRHMGSVAVARGLQSAGSVVVVHRLSCSASCGIFPDKGSNPCPLPWQVDS